MELITEIFIVIAGLVMIGLPLGFVALFVVMSVISHRKSRKSRREKKNPTMFEAKKLEQHRQSLENEKELYSEGEFARLERMSQPFDTDWKAEEDQLKELLAAGIIDKEEYDERILQVRL